MVMRVVLANGRVFGGGENDKPRGGEWWRLVMKPRGLIRDAY